MRRWKLATGMVAAAGAVWACAQQERVAVIERNAVQRVHQALFARLDQQGREVGEGGIDPLLYHDTRHLLEGESHAEALRALDELIRVPPGQVDPLQRALLQQDLWAVFQWANREGELEEPRKILRRRLAEAMRNASLTSAEIAQLPDNYAMAVNEKRFPTAFDSARPEAGFLPADLFDAKGPWVCVGAPRTREVVAPQHAEFFDGRSGFLVFINLPAGRNATEAYLRELSSVPQATVRDLRGGGSLDLVEDLPQVPVGTQVVLVRRMMLMDDRGQVMPTAVTQSVQFRVYQRIRPGSFGEAQDQRFFEFVLDRKELAAGRGGLRFVDPAGIAHGGFTSIIGEGDPFEAAAAKKERRHGPLTVLQSCHACHAGSGIYSVNSFSNGNSSAKPDPHLLPTTVEEELELARNFARRRAGFGKLRGIIEGMDRR